MYFGIFLTANSSPSRFMRYLNYGFWTSLKCIASSYLNSKWQKLSWVAETCLWLWRIAPSLAKRATTWRRQPTRSSMSKSLAWFMNISYFFSCWKCLLYSKKEMPFFTSTLLAQGVLKNWFHLNVGASIALSFFIKCFVSKTQKFIICSIRFSAVPWKNLADLILNIGSRLW